MVVNSPELRGEIKKRMIERGLRNKDLAEKTGYSVNAIDCVTGGYRAKISDNLMAAIASALGMEPERPVGIISQNGNFD